VVDDVLNTFFSEGGHYDGGEGNEGKGRVIDLIKFFFLISDDLNSFLISLIEEPREYEESNFWNLNSEIKSIENPWKSRKSNNSRI
jgi:hypothetical protein